MNEHEPRVSRLVVVLAALAGAVLAGLLLVWAVHERERPHAQRAGAARSTSAPPPAVAATPSKPAPPDASAAPAERPRARRKPAAPSTPPAAPAAPTLGELRIESDVPGAMVFLDRKYVGETPVTARDIAPGAHQLNLSADGFDGHSETIDVAPGKADVVVRFKEIRLNQSVDVVHKHGAGSCQGRLLATPQGLRYQTPNTNDAFSLSFDQLESFEVDYLKKNLRVKRRGGKTWNFTTRAESADPLFVFHREVQKVREKLASANR